MNNNSNNNGKHYGPETVLTTLYILPHLIPPITPSSPILQMRKLALGLTAQLVDGISRLIFTTAVPSQRIKKVPPS